jgi:hypothetical protein
VEFWTRMILVERNRNRRLGAHGYGLYANGVLANKLCQYARLRGLHRY